MGKKIEYTPLFLEFWNAYPRKTGKGAAFKSWTAQVDEQDAFQPKAIIEDIKKRNRLGFWHADKAKIPMPSTFLNQRRFEDEGWEDEIKTRGKENMPTSTAIIPPVKLIEAEYQIPAWAMMINRLSRNYLFKAGGLSESRLSILIRVKNQVWDDLKHAVNEEIDAAGDKTKAKQEMAFLIADTLLSRLDAALGLTLKAQVIDMSKRPA